MPKLDPEKYKPFETAVFRIKDTIGVPHPYCIGTEHVRMASDSFGGILGVAAIEAAERAGASCDICRHYDRYGRQRGILKFKDHETALLVAVKSNGVPLDKVPGLSEYLMSIKQQAESDGFAGFAFLEEK